VIEKEFNDRHGTNFAEAEMTRLEQVNRSIMSDDLSEMLRNNPAQQSPKCRLHGFILSILLERDTHFCEPNQLPRAPMS